MLIGMALEPEWIMDMCQTYTDLTIALQEIHLKRKGSLTVFGIMRSGLCKAIYLACYV